MITTFAVSAQFTGQDFAGPPASAGPYTNQNGPGMLATIQLVQGNNNIVYPDASFTIGGMWIEPQVVNTGATLTMKGSAGDTGIVLSTTNPSLIPIATPPPGVVPLINASVTTPLVVRWV